MNIDLKQITEKAKELFSKKNTEQLKEIISNNKANETEIQTIINSLSEEKKLDYAEVLVIISVLLQQGATSPKTPGKKTYNRISVDDLRRHTKLVNNKLTLRQLARGLRQNIIEIVIIKQDDTVHVIEGNLAKKMRKELGSITNEEAAWASDFQTDNPNCPPKVKNWLKKNYKDQFK